MAIIQVPSLVLPYPYTNTSSMEIVADTVPHNSVDIPVEPLGEKTAIIWATEVVALGVPGPLWCWVELSPFPSSVTTAFFAAIGGGGGPSYPGVPAMVPVTPTIEVATGTNDVVHTIMLRWLNHSPWARIRVGTPGMVATATWAVQVWVMGKG